jgi:2'-hydroxyisoflavone reductase
MRLLVLGGTSFVGRHIVEAALAAGHEVTLFNRGKTNPGLFPQCEARTGDREAGDYASLADGRWDGVVDVNAYWPRAVREAEAAVAGRAGHYTFISTGSVYAEVGDGPLTEDHARAQVDDPATEVVDNDTYGGLKTLCEDEAVAAWGEGSVAIVRCGVVAGPFDPTDRFTYWVRRGTRGGPALAVRPDQPVQVVHGRDVGDFVVRAAAEGLTGPFNCMGPTEPVDMAGMLAACGVDEPVWVSEAFMREHKAYVPLYLPSAMGVDGLFRGSIDRALAHGFRNRPLAETAADTRAWDQGREGASGDLPGGPSAADEARLVEEWRRQGAGTDLA